MPGPRPNAQLDNTAWLYQWVYQKIQEFSKNLCGRTQCFCRKKPYNGASFSKNPEFGGTGTDFSTSRPSLSEKHVSLTQPNLIPYVKNDKAPEYQNFQTV